MKKQPASLKERLGALSESKANLLESLLRKQAVRSQVIAAQPRRPHEGRVRFSSSWAQERLWFIEQLEDAGAAYNVSIALNLRGALDLAALQRALDALVQRHEVLRTSFVDVAGQPVQDITAAASFPLSVFDLSSAETHTRVASLRDHVRVEVTQPFDLGSAPLIRGRLVRLAEEEHVLVLIMHHIVSDGWSVNVLLRELRELYAAEREERAARLAPLPLQYADYAHWQRHSFKGNVFEDQLSYWRGRLQGVTPHLELPTDRPRPAVQSYRGASVYLELDGELHRDLKAYARRHGMTTFMVLYAAWAILLSRLSGQEDIAVGTPVLNRLRQELEGLIGFFVNSLVLRVAVPAQMSVQDFLAQVQDVTLGGYDHQDMPFEKIVEILQPERTLNRHPVFQAAFVMQATAVREADWAHLQVRPHAIEHEAAQFDVTLSLEENDALISGSINYATDLFDTTTIERWSASYLVLLQDMVAGSQHRNVGELSILPPAQRQQVLEGFNATAAEYPKDKLLHEWFEERVACAPAATAVVYQDRSLSYHELNDAAERVARHLRRRGIGPDQRVGICVERGIEMLIGIFGCWKAGAAYVPLDPAYPPERLAYIVEDANPSVILTQTSARSVLPSGHAEVIALDEELPRGVDDESLPERVLDVRPDHLAYVIYTSGSTGRPKGVMIEHRHVVNLWQGLERVYAGHAECRRVALNASYNFDASVQQLMQLLSGRTLYIVPEDVRRDSMLLVDFLKAHAIEGVDCTPSQLRAWLQAGLTSEGGSLRWLLVGGEAIDAELWETLARSTIDCFNVYGPTECTVDATVAPLRGDFTSPHIGRPMSNRRVYILDRHGKPQPVGVIGEIHIGGEGISRGYLNRPELTAERFLRDSFVAGGEGRVYKTGDLGRWRADGTIEFLGRNDDQVKIRGFRMELGEIEAQLLRHEQVKEAAVIAREDARAEKQLVGYVVPAIESMRPSIEDLLAHLRKNLPDYMLPRAIIVLERMPLTPNGKLDRGALPNPDLATCNARQYEPPQGEIEETLARIWEELLRVERVGRHDHFFGLGGHSLLIMQMLDRLRRVGLTTQARQVFDHPTLAGLASALAVHPAARVDVPPNLIPAGCTAITPQMVPLVRLEPEHIERIARTVPGGAANVQDIYPLAPLQEGILFHHLLAERRGDTYVTPIVLSVEDRQRLDALIAAMQAAVDRHDVLRTAVLWENLPQPIQVVYRRAQLTVEEVALEPGRPDIEQIHDWVRPERQRIDLRQAPLLRLRVANGIEQNVWYVMMQVHHITSDHVTLEAITAEVVAELQGLAAPAASIGTYRTHVARALAYARTDDAEAFFSARLADVDEPTIPFGLANVHGDGTQIREAHEQLSPALAKRVRTQASQYGVSAATLFHSAWGLVVAHTSGRDDVVFGSVLLGRLQGGEEAQRTLGMFINTLPLRLRLAGLAAADLIQQTHKGLIELLTHERASLAVAQRCSGISGSAPLFSALLNFRHGSADSNADWSNAAGVKVVLAQERSNYPITVSVDDLGGEFALTAQTDHRIDPRRLIGYLHTAVLSLVLALEGSSRAEVLSLPILPQDERRKLIESFNDTRTSYPRDRAIHELFEEQVSRAPQAVAAIFEGQELSYATLNQRANQLARFLQRQGVEPGEYVPVVMSRSLEMLIAQVAVLKCGAAYVPLDAQLPALRRDLLLRDCGGRRVLGVGDAPAGFDSQSWQWIDCATHQCRAESGDNLSVSLPEPRAAYVMYTSGSTGMPKGVIVPHHAVNRLVINNGYAQLGAQDCLAHYSNPAFDASTFEIWGALLNGARVLIVPQAVVLDSARFADSLREHAVTVLWMSVGLFNQYARSLSEVFEGLTYLIVGGDVLEPGKLREVLRHSAPRHFLNGYGPTECTTFSTTYRVESSDTLAPSIPIGRPIANAQVYVLDARRQPVPLGAVGELYIGGDGVAVGYLNRPQLTAERFVVAPFKDAGRLYRTGDLGRWREDGVIEFLGRNDHQVKIRGFRIELGEIEAQLLRHEAVQEAVVLAREDLPGAKRLVAYVVSKDESSPASVEDLRAQLKASLPEYMVPSAFVTLAALPLTPNGKVDRRALPIPELEAYASGRYEAPQGEVEEVLSGIWQELLHVERVGRHDNFFELGGHSLLLVQMMERLRRVGLAAEVRSIFDNPTLAGLAECLLQGIESVEVPDNRIPEGTSAIAPSMLPLVELSAEHIERIVKRVPGGAANVQDIYPLAPLQEGILFHHLLDTAAGDTYVLPTLLSVSSSERLERLIAALQIVMNRHDVLRTAVLWEELPQPVQVVYRHSALPVEQVELDRDRDLNEQLQAWLAPAKQSMDLRRAPLMRLQVARDPDGARWYVLLQLHHIAVDGMSFRDLMGEVVEQLEGRADALPPPAPYREHVAQTLAHARKQDAEAFFRSKLGDVEEPTVPFGLTEVYEDGTRFEEVTIELAPELSQRVRVQGRQLGVSVAAMFHAAWGLVLAHTSHRDDVVFGSVLLGRMQSRASVQPMLGLFINTLPLRLQLHDVNAKTLVERTQREIIELLNYEQASLAVAQRCSALPGSVPLFSTLFNYRHGLRDQERTWSDASGIQELASRAGTNYAITVSIDDLGTGFAITAQTDRRIQPQRIAAYLNSALLSLTDALERVAPTPALQLSVLPAVERRQVLENFNDTRSPYQTRLIHELVEQQVERFPSAVALEYEDRSLRYAELNAQANRLAYVLRERGVGPDDVVALCVERSFEMVIGLLGILKAGAAYLPLDPNYPSERLAYMVHDARPRLVLTQQPLLGRVATLDMETLALDALPGLETQPSHNLSAADTGLRPEHLLYVIYTSGSTGQPKGTAMSHAAMANLIEWHRATLPQSPRVLQFAALSFDVAFQDMFSTLCTGGTLVLLNEWIRRDASALLHLMSDRRIERVFLPPLMLQSLAEAASSSGIVPHSLKDVITAGEQLRVSPEIVELFVQLSDARLHNHYGPTETHVVTALTLPGEPRQWPRLPTIGRPVANTQMYVLDAHRQAVPLGAIGEIYIGGANLARGYLRRQQLTSERFVPDPFSEHSKARLYKTGDLGRWHEDGTLEYLGRNDDQVKIRGFRIELGEVEAQLALHPAVKEAAVVARESAGAEKRLVAYLTLLAEPAVSAADLRAHAKSLLPEHMVPSAFVVLESLPLTPSGKLNRRALPAPDLDAYATRDYEAPRGEVEEILAGIWQSLLRVQRVGRRDHFFELGGHSLLIVQMLERLRRVGLSTSLRRVLESASLMDLASALKQGEGDRYEAPPNRIPEGCTAISPEMLPLVQLEPEHIERIVKAVPGGAANVQDIYPLTPLQEGIHFHHLASASGADAYVRPMAMVVDSADGLQRFITALQALVDRHDVLRTAILWEELPRPVQVVYRRATLHVLQITLDPDRDTVEQVLMYLAPERQRFDLRHAPLLRLQVAADPHSERCYVIWQLHHIVDDGVSGGLMAAEILEHVQGRARELAPPSLYRNYVAQAIAYAQTGDAEKFFGEKLHDVEEPTAPFGLLNVHGDGTDVEDAHEELPTALASRIRTQASRYGISVATLFHAAWSLVVAHTSGRDDVVFGTVLSGRLQGGIEAQRALGMFINTLPLRLRLQNCTAEMLVHRTQREFIELLAREQASLAQAQRCSGISGSAPLFSALLNYRHGTPETSIEWSEATGVHTLAASGGTNYPIAMSVDDLGEGFALTAQTDRRIDPRRLNGYLHTALQSLVQALEQSSRVEALSLPILPHAERRQLIELFNDTRSSYPRDRAVHELFEEQVRRSPAAVAALFEGQELSYRALNARANQLARYLQRHGVALGEYVPVVMSRSLEMLVAQLAVLKCGGAYVPMDAQLPLQRRDFMLLDCGARRVLGIGSQPEESGLDSLQWIDCAAIVDELSQESGENLSLELDANMAAYVMYTSGSTGAPKGVIVPHRAINRLAINNGYAEIRPQDCLAHYSNPAFDASTFEIWCALLNGARMVIVAQATVLDAARFASTLREHGVTMLYMSVGLFNQYASALREVFPQLKYLMIGGDSLESGKIREVLQDGPPCHLLNVYGPTECTTYSTSFLIGEADAQLRNIPIGRPMSNAQIYLLDSRRQPVPLGALGELYIGGDGVALGYLNRAELTAERFIADPFKTEGEARLYKTGDLGRWRVDGVIEFVGRNDQQVKIRGFRIELGEIEAQLLRHEQVQEAVVMARQDVSGEKRLVAYIVTHEGETSVRADALRTHLKLSLPEYMVPSAFVALPSLPLTPNGKVDRRALPAPQLDAYASGTYEAPQGEVEEILAGIWQELLRVERVGRHDNFFELGGHSLLIVQLMERLRRVGLTTAVREVFDSPTLAALAERLLRGEKLEEVPPNLIPAGSTAITPQMLSLVQLEPEHIERIVQAVPGGAANIQDIYPLAPLQEGILFHHLANRGSDIYVQSLVLSMSSREQLDEFVEALRAVIDTHDVLRTAVLWEELPQPVQVVYRHAELPVEEEILDESGDSHQRIRAWLEPETQRMNLQHAPLMQLRIAEDRGSRRWHVLWQLHHIIDDGMSWNMLLGDIAAHLEDRADKLPQAVPYRNYVARALIYSRKHDAEAFFRSKLADIDESTAPFGVLDVREDVALGEGVHEELAGEFADAIRATARRLGVSAATLFHAAWALVVAHTSGRNDVVFGSVLLGRLHASTDSQRAMGLFINTLPLRLSLENLNVRELVQSTQRELVELLAHEQAPLSSAQRCSGVSGSTPLFTALLNYRHGTEQTQTSLVGLEGIEVLAAGGGTNYPLTLSIDDSPRTFTLRMRTDQRIDPVRMIGYVRTAMESLVSALQGASPARALNLPILPELERRQLIESFNQPPAPVANRLLHELFEEQVERIPQMPAVVYEGQSLSYAELNARANIVARSLRERGVGPDQRVGLCIERSVEMMIGILACWKAGGAYVPIDPQYPAERLNYMLQDAAPRVLLTQAHLRSRFSAAASSLLVLESEQLFMDVESSNVPTRADGLGPEHLAYVIYTSGSTGQPKGVMIEHRHVVSLCQALEQLLQKHSDCQRVALNASVSFDGSVKQLVQVLFGRTLYILPQDVRRDPASLLKFIAANEIEGVDCTPSQLRAWVEAGLLSMPGCPLRWVLIGGEAIDPELWNQLAQHPAIDFLNVYGPTECTVDTTATLLRDAGTVPHIGRPIAHRRVYILGQGGEPQPIGVSGELYIGGAGVARGYLNRSELTASRFVADPFSSDIAGRLYRSGDLGRWNADGSIEYLGRTDSQVKVRGYRIELGEIEAQLIAHERVREAAVIAWDRDAGQKNLCAYVVPRDIDGPPATDELRAYLKAVLPEFMVPGAFVFLDAMPLTASGKVDRRALPQPEVAAGSTHGYEPPSGELEGLLASIWQSLLRVERVGRHDNFFELGGHSLLIMRMMERLRRAGLTIDVGLVFESPTIAELAGALSNEAIGRYEVPANLIPPGCTAIAPQMLPLVSLEAEHVKRIVEAIPGGAANIQDIYPLAPLQEGILFHFMLNEQGVDPYLRSLALRLPSRSQLERFVAALRSVMDRQDVLRTAILWEQLPHPVQVVCRLVDLPLLEHRLDPERDPMEQVQEWMDPAQHRLDLRRAPLMSLQTAEDLRSGQCYVVWQLHHIIDDGMSWSTLLEEIGAQMIGNAHELPPAVAYRDYVARTLSYARTHDVEGFFRSKLADVDEPTAPFGLLDARGSDIRVEEAAEELDLSVARKVRAQANRHGVSAATIFHAAFALVVARTSNRDDVVFGSVLLGRLQGGVESGKALGLFINTLPLRLKLAALSSAELVKWTQRGLVELMMHERAPLAVAQRCSGMNASTPLFTALFNYRHGSPAEVADWTSTCGIEQLAASGGTNYPITVSVDDLGEAFVLSALTDQRISASRLTAYLRTAVQSLVEALDSSANEPVLSLPILPWQEQRRVMGDFNANTDVDVPEKLLHELFEEQVARTPDVPAVMSGGRSLTYAQLNVRANRLARRLRANSVGPNQLVGLYVESGVEMLIGIIACWKAGGAYVPLDPQYPPERFAYMLADAAPRVLLTQLHLMDRLSTQSVPVITLDGVQGESTGEADNLPVAALGMRPDQLAYVIYTSGSTGQPKGVMIEHRHAVGLWTAWARVDVERARHSQQECRRIAVTSSFNFDASVLQLLQLLSGRTLYIVDQQARLDAALLLKFIAEHAIEVLEGTPSQLRAWIHAGLLRTRSRALRRIIVGGEAVDPELWAELARHPEIDCFNAYGPTECTVDVTVARVEDPDATPHIGRPIANRRVYLLDSHGNPQPIGVAGELYVGGASVARGYLNRPQVTAERFVADPFGADAGGRLYKTGDLGRWREDGTIEFLGRNDDQVKIRGFRIELGEIELQLLRHEQIEEAVVLAREDAPGEKRLVAYVVSSQHSAALRVDDLRAYLRKSLPEYMVPSALVLLPSLPLTPSGKVNRQALPPPEFDAYSSASYEQPIGEVEEVVAEIWQQLLQVERLGRHDNFFELGGHSLHAMKLTSEIESRLSVRLSVANVFRHSTIADMAQIIESQRVISGQRHLMMQSFEQGEGDDGFDEGTLELNPEPRQAESQSRAKSVGQR